MDPLNDNSNEQYIIKNNKYLFDLHFQFYQFSTSNFQNV